ncbi:MAG: HAMP domain-containing histidine kinase [Deltaproteobacteria bacterium]|nr:HAMP domain-containing histidine kinase [Deltaproteobacteria bacterium]
MRSKRSIGFPLTLGIILLILVLTLAVGWQILVWSGAGSVERGLTNLDWIFFVLGAVCFLLIIVGLVWLCAWLVREIGVNQHQRAFLDAVTHEMKTPLASLRLYLDTLERHDPERERRHEFLDRMRVDLERLDQTVEQVLTAARAEESRSRARLERVVLSELLEECIAEICTSHHLPEGAVRLESGRGAMVKGDPGELSLVFRNLLENAVKYSDEPVEVKVRVVDAADGRVKVEIADRGIGIPSGELRKIFQRFYRVGRDVQRTAVGLGLGLFIVRNLVRRQGGRVVARSEGWGQGSRFVVTLRAAF